MRSRIRTGLDGAARGEVTDALRIDKLHAGYGAVEVLRGVDLDIRPGEIVSVVGANGAGKSTLLHVIAGHVHPVAGDVVSRSRNITRFPPHKVLASGVAFVHQGQSLFPQLTVEENILIGGYTLSRLTRNSRTEEAFETFPALAEKKNARAASLSGGQRQLLKLARALMVRPHTLLLDEPTAGLSPVAVSEFNEVLTTQIKPAGVAVLMVEQNLRNAFRLSDRMAVLELGVFTDTGTPSDVKEHGALDRVVLGG